MPVRLSRYFEVEPSELTSRGVFDAHLGIDNKLFVDPKLLKKKLKLPEFTGARKDITQYFSKVIKLLKASRKEGDAAWLAAEKRMRFKEENGAALGYGKAGSFGRAVGAEIAHTIVKRAKEILDLGVDDPEMFELIGLFQEDVGSDLLSDMAVSILKPRFLAYTQRVTNELNLQPSETFQIDDKTWNLPMSPDGKRALILVPRALLSKLPIALDRSEINEVASLTPRCDDGGTRLSQQLTRRRSTRARAKYERCCLRSDKTFLILSGSTAKLSSQATTSREIQMVC